MTEGSCPSSSSGPLCGDRERGASPLSFGSSSSGGFCGMSSSSTGIFSGLTSVVLVGTSVFEIPSSSFQKMTMLQGNGLNSGENR